MSAIDKVKAHWSDIAEIESIDVPEWEMTVYFTPLNIREAAKIDRIIRRDGEVFASVDILIMKCQDEQGEPLFTKADKPVLMRTADPKVVERICGAIGRVDDPGEIEGN